VVGTTACTGVRSPGEPDGVVCTAQFVYGLSKPGYASTTLNDVRVDANVCHVIPNLVTLELKR
jgi:hypothetical protein